MAQFQPGQSGNPGGRPRVIGMVRDLAREQTEASIRALVDVRDDTSAPPAARVSAANSLLDRGWGKPSQPISGDAENPLQIIYAGAREALSAKLDRIARSTGTNHPEESVANA